MTPTALSSTRISPTSQPSISTSSPTQLHSHIYDPSDKTSTTSVFSSGSHVPDILPSVTSPTMHTWSSDASAIASASGTSTVASGMSNAVHPERSSTQRHKVIIAVTVVCGSLGLAALVALACRLRTCHRGASITPQEGPKTRSHPPTAADARSPEAPDRQILSSSPSLDHGDHATPPERRLSTSTKTQLDIGHSRCSIGMNDGLRSIEECPTLRSRTLPTSNSIFLEPSSVHGSEATLPSRPPSYHEDV